MNWATHCAWHPDQAAKATLAQDDRPGMCEACFDRWRMVGVKGLGEVPAVRS